MEPEKRPGKEKDDKSDTSGNRNNANASKMKLNKVVKASKSQVKTPESSPVTIKIMLEPRSEDSESSVKTNRGSATSMEELMFGGLMGKQLKGPSGKVRTGNGARPEQPNLMDQLFMEILMESLVEMMLHDAMAKGTVPGGGRGAGMPPFSSRRQSKTKMANRAKTYRLDAASNSTIGKRGGSTSRPSRSNLFRSNHNESSNADIELQMMESRLHISNAVSEQRDMEQRLAREWRQDFREAIASLRSDLDDLLDDVLWLKAQQPLRSPVSN